MNAIAAINAYNKIGAESSVIGADPHKLISMLFQGALLAIANAKNGMLRKETAVKGKSISKAIAIIGEGLNASLNKSVGGELAHNLSSLYDYMVMRLVDANLKNDITVLDEVTRLLTELTEAWDSIRPNNAQSESQPKASVNAQQAYGRA
jgi:flagellar secretion chaperone FliS